MRSTKSALVASIICLAIAWTGQVAAQSSAAIPVSVSKLDSYRMGDNLLRVVRHNMEIEPSIEFELLATPEMKRLQTLSVSRVTVNGEVLDFAQSEGVFVEALRAEEHGIEVDFDYFYSGGGSDVIRCRLPVMDDSFGKLTCKKS